jgi:DNA-binding MarR family transcriptional regulator
MADPVALSDELMSTIAALRRVVRRNLRPTMPGPALRGAHIELIRAVKNRPGIGVAAVARELGLAPNSVSTLVNQLLEMDMLTRQTDPGDRRAARLHLTGAAVRRLDAWRQARTELVGEALGRLSTSDRETLADALPALRALLANLEVEEEGS